MSIMNSLDFRQGQQTNDDRWRRQRADNALAFQTYVDQQTALGRKVSPQELDQYRMRLSGGNSYLMGGIPGQVILEDVARQQHVQAQQAQTAALATQAEQQQQIRAQLAQLVPIDAPIEKVQEVVFKSFGESAPQVWGMYEHDIPTIQDEKVVQKATVLADTERFRTLRGPEDVAIMFPGESPRVHAKLAEMAQVQAANSREASMGRTIEMVGRLDLDLLSRMTPEHRANTFNALARASGLGEPTADELLHLNGIADALSGAATTMRTDSDKRAFNDTLWQHLTDHMRSGGTLSEEDILNVARRSAASHGVPIETMEDLERHLGTDMQRWIRAESYKHSWNAQYEAEAMRASTMVQMEVEHEKVRVTTDYGNAVKNGSLRDGSHAHSALLALTEQGQFLSSGDTQEHIEFAARAEKRGGLTPDQIRAALIEEYGVRTPGEMAEIAAMSAMDRAGLGIRPGTSMANELEDTRIGIEQSMEIVRQTLPTIPEAQREAYLSGVAREMQNTANAIRRDVRNRKGHAGYAEFTRNETIRVGESDLPWVVAAEEAANRIEEQILELRQQASAIPYDPETSGTQDADELMRGGVAPARGEPRALPQGELEERLEQLQSALDQIPRDEMVARGFGSSYTPGNPELVREAEAIQREIRRIEEEMRRRRLAGSNRRSRRDSGWLPPEAHTPEEEPEPEPEPQSSLESPYRRVGSIPNNDAVVAAADVAHRFESLYGQVGERTGSQFVGDFQIGDAKREELGLTKAQARDPTMARYAYERWAYQRAIPALEQAGIPASPAAIYLTWQQGVAGFREIYSTAQSDLPPSAARQRNMDNNRPPALPGEPRLPKGATAREWLAAWERAIRTHKATDQHQEALRRGTTRQA